MGRPPHPGRTDGSKACAPQPRTIRAATLRFQAPEASCRCWRWSSGDTRLARGRSATPTIQMENSPASRWLCVARIVRPHGVRGEVVADLLTDYPQRFAEHPEVFVRAAEATAPPAAMRIEGSRMHGERILLRFAGCDSMEAAERLRGRDLVVPWENRMPLGPDEIYIADLVDAVLVNAKAGQAVGTVVDVDRESTHTPLLVVQTPQGGDALLVPFVKAYSPEWDPRAHTLTMDLPEGLLELQSGGGDSV